MNAREEALAYHVAGHAVAAYILRQRFSKVSIVDDADNLGHLAHGGPHSKGFHPEWDDSPRTRTQAEKEIMVYFAGAAAEKILTGTDPIESSDLTVAVGLTFALTASLEETLAYLRWLQVRTKELLAVPHHWAAVGALAQELLARGEVSYRKARRVIARAVAQDG